MVQIRIMGDDAERARLVLELMLPLLQASPALLVGDVTNLHHRGGGGRFVFDVSPAGAGPVTITVERDDPSPGGPGRRRRDVGGGPRALPRGPAR